MSKYFNTLTVKELIKESINAVSIVFEIPENLKSEFQYQSGQYLTIKKTIAGEEVRRSYSISSCEKVENDIKVTSKMLQGGKMSTFLFQELGVGDELEVMSPDGNFTLEDKNKPLVLFAAGSGITPIISILKEALAEGINSVSLYYGNRTEEEVIFKNELTQLQEKYSDRLLVQHYLSSDGERLDKERTQSIVNGMKGIAEQANYFICGPEAMIAAVKSGLLESNISDNQINIEYFASPKTESTKIEEVVSGDVADITVVIDDEEHQLTLQAGEAILDGASRIGVDPPFSCQSGVCTTCKAKVISGKVEMENNFGLGEDEIEDGFVLTCISKPTSAGVKISWDEV